MFKDMVISMMGMSLLVFANDFVTMSLATDNAKDAPEPSIWNVKNITLASLGIGVFLVAQGLGAVFLANRTFGLDFAHMQAFVLLMLVFTSQFRVLMVRARGAMWNSAPGKNASHNNDGRLHPVPCDGYNRLYNPRAGRQIDRNRPCLLACNDSTAGLAQALVIPDVQC